MPFYLEKKGTHSTPSVLIDEKKNYMKLEGMCFHENIIAFFKDIMHWLDEYITTDFGTFTFDCKMRYFNSSSSKILHDMFEIMDENAVGDKKVIVNWHIDKDDSMLAELCEDIEDEYKNLTISVIKS